MPEEVFRGVKFNCKITWDKDVMKVTHSVSDVYNDAVKKMSDDLNDKTEAEVLRHFEIDMTELREFLRYKQAGLSLPLWNPVENGPPKDDSDVLAFYDDGIESRIIPATYHSESGWYDCLFNKPVEHITHWIIKPLPPKEVHNG